MVDTVDFNQPEGLLNERPLFASVDSPATSSTGRIWLAFLMMPLVSALAAGAIFPVVSLRGADAAGSGIFAFVAAIAAVFVTLAERCRRSCP